MPEDPSGLVAAARAELSRLGPGEGPAGSTAFAPGRCTLVGEHVDYAGGLVLCLAIDMGVAVAVRRSGDGVWRARSAGRVAVRAGAGERRGDIGDRILAPAVALAALGLPIPPLEVGVAASLPEGAGLSSSAAILCAAAAAMLRLTGGRCGARDLAAALHRVEREVVGAPVGPLDHRAIVEAPPGGVLLLDCRDGGSEPLLWPWPELVLVACDTGTAHDVAGGGYRRRREEAERALAELGAASCRDLPVDVLEAASLEEVSRRRARHLVTETARSAEAAAALRRGDAERLGALMSASHASLRDDAEVSTPGLDAAVAAAEAVPGCLGARLVGAGFGGSAIALVEAAAAARCASAMERAAGRAVAAMERAAGGGGDAEVAGGRRPRSWTLRPGPGLAWLSPDVIVSAPT